MKISFSRVVRLAAAMAPFVALGCGQSNGDGAGAASDGGHGTVACEPGTPQGGADGSSGTMGTSSGGGGGDACTCGTPYKYPDGGAPGVVQVAPPTGIAANDGANINAAIALLPSTGGFVQLQAGTYVVPAPSVGTNGCVTMSVNNSTLAGMGIGVTTIQLAPGSGGATGIVRTPAGVANTHITFRDFTIDGNKSQQTASANVVGFYAGVTAMSTQTDADIQLIRVESMNNSTYGFETSERTTRTLFEGCIGHDNGLDGFLLAASYEGTVIGSTAYNNLRDGFDLVTASSGNRLVGDEAYANSGAGVVLQAGSKNNVVEGCTIHDNQFEGILVNGLPQSGQVDNTPGTNNAIVGNYVENSGTHGIHVVSESGIQVASNTVRDSSQMMGGTSSQIFIDDTGGSSGGGVFSTHNTVYANSLGVTAGVSGAPNYGISENSTGDDSNMYIANQSLGALTAQWLFQGPYSVAYAAHNGITGAHPATYAYASDSPANHGLVEWNFPPQSIGTTTTPLLANTVYFAALTLQNTFTVGHVDLYLGVLGSGLTSGDNVVGLYTLSTASGTATLASASADQTTAWTSGTGSAKSSAALTTSVAVTAGQTVMVGILSVGTNPPAFGIGPDSSGAPASLGKSASTPFSFSVYVTTGTPTSLPSSVPLTTSGVTTTSSKPIWVGLDN